MNRREFVLGGLAAATGLVLSCSDSSPAKTKAEQLFGRGYEVDFAKFSQGFIYKLSHDDYSPSKEETESLFQEMAKIRPELNGLEKRDFINGKSYYAVIAEPDKAYCKKLEEQTRISIEHAKRFFNFPEFNDISIDFKVPETSKEVIFNDNPLPAYFVAGLIKRKELTYKVKTLEGKSLTISPKLDESPRGIAEAEFQVFPATRDRGAYINYSNKKLIFSTTTCPLEDIIKTPIDEFLHSVFTNVTLDCFNKKYGKIVFANEIYEQGFRRLRNREERFVHALGILWLEQYNQDRDLGFSKEKLLSCFAKQEASDDCYKGMMKLAEHIKKIGLQESRRLYVEAPDELFSVIEK